MDLIAFVILHYKDFQTTDTCVQSILRMKQQDRIRIVIVDNDVTETAEKRKKLKEFYQDTTNIHVLSIGGNGGFSYANNQGYQYAREQIGASFILVLNNDIEFIQMDFVKRLGDVYQKHLCHVLGPDIIRRSTGEHQNPMDTRIRTKQEAEYTIRMNKIALKWYSLLYPFLYLQNKRAEKRLVREKTQNDVYYSSVQEGIVPFGACLIYTPDFVCREKRAFEPETQFYYEEYILTVRCQNKKYRIVYDPSLKLLHESGTATRKKMGNQRKRLRFMMERTMEACRVYLEYLCD